MHEHAQQVAGHHFGALREHTRGVASVSALIQLRVPDREAYSRVFHNQDELAEKNVPRIDVSILQFTHPSAP